MTEPRRIVEERAGQWEADLLRSVRRERAPVRTQRKVLVSLGLLGAAMPSAALVATAKAATMWSLPLVQWIGIGAGVATMVVGGATLAPHVFSRPSPAQNVASAATARATSASPSALPAPPSALAPAPPIAPEATAIAPVGNEAEAEAKALPAEVVAPLQTPPAVPARVATGATSERVEARPPTAPLVPTSPASTRTEAAPQHEVEAPEQTARSAASAERAASLLQQVAMLDNAKHELRLQDPRGALGWLDRYGRTFPHGDLEPEATVLRVEAWVALGQRARARSLADSYLANNPQSSHAARLRALVGESNP